MLVLESMDHFSSGALDEKGLRYVARCVILEASSTYNGEQPILPYSPRRKFAAPGDGLLFSFDVYLLAASRGLTS